MKQIRREAKLIGKVMKNNSFTATTKYVVEKEKATIIGGNMVGENTRELATEFMMGRDLNPSISRPVYHFTLSLSKQEDLNDKTFALLAETYLKGMFLLHKGQDIDKNFSTLESLDINSYQFITARHADREHNHIHIIANRIDLLDGKAVETWHDRFRSQKIIRKLEQTYNLKPEICSWEVGRKAQTKGQLAKLTFTGINSVKFKLQEAIEKFAISKPTVPEFLEQLKNIGTEVNIAYDSSNKIRGISYCLDNVAISGSKLGKRYSFPGLQHYLGISYQPERDDAAIIEIIASKTNNNYAEQRASEQDSPGARPTTIAARNQSQYSRTKIDTRSAVAGSNRTKKSSQQFRTEHTKRNQHMDRNQSELNAAAIASSGNNRQADSRVNEIRAAQEQFRQAIDKLERSVTEFEREVTRGEDIWQQHDSNTREQQEIREVVETTSNQDITHETDALWRDNNLSGDLNNVGDVGRDSSIDILVTNSGVTTRNTEPDQQQNQQYRNSVTEVGKTNQTLKQTTDSSTDSNDDNDPLDTQNQQKGSHHKQNSQFLITDAKQDKSSDFSRTNNRTQRYSSASTQSRAQTELDKIQREWAKAIYPIALQTYEQYTQQGRVMNTASGTALVEGKYQLSQNREKNTLVLTTNDGRGELIKYKDDNLEYAANLENQDLENWKAIEQQLNQINTVQVQNTYESSADVELDI